MSIHPIRFGDEGTLATRELQARLEALAPAVATAALREQVAAMAALDRQHGGEGPLPVEDADALVDAALAELARAEARHRGDAGVVQALSELVLGVALWAVRHAVRIGFVEPVVNALALRSNSARSRAELTAVFGLMQGVIAHVSPALSADLERSNPERPWRLLHANLAITAIRSEDPALMDHAFDALDAALPDERAGFYGEALALALAPGIAPAVRTCIEARHATWTRRGET